MMFLLFVVVKFNINSKQPAIVVYSPMFVNDNERLPSTGASILNKLVISN